MHADFWINIHNNPGISQSLLVIPTLVWRHTQVHPKISLVLRRVPKLITHTPFGHLYLSSEIPVTLKTGWNALLGSDTLLKLTFVSLHYTSSQTLLQSPTHEDTCSCASLPAWSSRSPYLSPSSDQLPFLSPCHPLFPIPLPVPFTLPCLSSSPSPLSFWLPVPGRLLARLRALRSTQFS